MQWGKNATIEQKEGNVQLKLQSPKEESSQVVRMEMEMPTSKVERLFGDDFNQDLVEATQNIDFSKLKF